MTTERTFIMIKPDGVHRGIVGEIIKRFENKGFKLVAMKYMQVILYELYLLTTITKTILSRPLLSTSRSIMLTLPRSLSLLG